MSEGWQVNREIELKFDLGSFTNYLKLIGHLGQIDREIHQVNSFFDSEDRKLSSGGWALRVRLENDRGLITAKSRGSADNTASIRDEIEAELDPGRTVQIQNLQMDLLDIDLPPVQFVKESFGKIELARVAHFVNTRRVKEFRIGDYRYHLELDTTEFPDGSVDYELEVELSRDDQIDVVRDYVGRLFNLLDIPVRNQTETKFARALERTGRF